MADRIKDPRSEVSIGPTGLSLKTQLEAVQSKVEVLQADHDSTKSILFGAALPQERKALERHMKAGGIPESLTKLAQEYMALDIADYTARIRKKAEIAEQLTGAAISERVSRDVLADSNNDAHILALAGAVLVLPEDGDLNRLLRASRSAKQLFVKFRLTLAFARLAEKGLVPAANADEVLLALSALEQGADNSLLRRIHQTKALLQETFAAEHAR